MGLVLFSRVFFSIFFLVVFSYPQSSITQDKTGFGRRLEISGDTIIFGFYQYNSNNGMAMIYSLNYTSGFFEHSTSLFPATSETNYFGSSVAIFGDHALIGAIRQNFYDSTEQKLYSNQGSIYFYKKNKDGTWEESSNLTPLPSWLNDYFGTSTSITSNSKGIFAFAGAPGRDFPHDGNCWDVGSVFVYELLSNGTWIQQDELQPSDKSHCQNSGDNIGSDFGTKIHSNGEFLGVTTSLEIGEVYFFQFQTSTQKYIEITKIDGEISEEFGSDIAIGGLFSLVGAQKGKNNDGITTGIVYCYKFDSTTNSWIENQVLSHSDLKANALFGSSVAIKGNFAFIGAKGDDSNVGSVYIFKLNSATNIWEFLLKIKDDESSTSSSYYGEDVSYDSNYLVFGSQVQRKAVIKSLCFDSLYCQNGATPDFLCSKCEDCNLQCPVGLIENKLCSECVCPESYSLVFGSCQKTNLVVGIISVFSICVFIIFCFIIGSLILFPILCYLSYRHLKYSKVENLDLIIEEQEMASKEQQEHVNSKKSFVSSSSLSSKKIKVDEEIFKLKSSEIKILKKIEQGGDTSVIYLCDYHKTKVVFKCFKSPLLGTDDDIYSEFEKEVSIIAGCKFPYILGYLGATIEPRIGILLEYCSNGDIEHYLRKNKVQFSKKMKFIGEICMSMEYLHSKSILHRDLKCKNVLLTESLETRLMDFGLSSIFNNADLTRTKRIGTSRYMSPEIVNSSKYDFKCDVFSAAIMIWEILLQDFNPYITKSSFGIENKVSSDPQFRPSLDYEIFHKREWLRNLLIKCWDHDPNNRFTFEEIVKIIYSSCEFL